MGEVALQCKSDFVPGTTGDDYVEVVRVDTRSCGYQGKTIIKIKNTHATSTLYYKIDGYLADPDGTLGEDVTALKAETSLAANTLVTDTTAVVIPYGAVVISIKKNSAVGGFWVAYCTY